MNKPAGKAAKRASSSQAQTSSPDSDQDQVEEEQETFLESFFAAIPKFSSTWMTSMILHTGLIIVLAVITMTQLEDETITLAMGDVSPQVENLIETPLEFEEMEEPVEEEFEEFTETFEQEMTSEVVTEALETNMLVNTDFGDLSADVDMTEVFGDGEMSLEETSKMKPKFFNAGNAAKKIVYVVDNSNSMTGKNAQSKGYGRMETALIELAKSINSLDRSQYFYVVFYSDTAYGLFHPNPVSDYIRATPRNKEMVHAWLDTVQCCLRTNGQEAFDVARRLEPELIYVLGDGAFGDKAHVKLVENPIKGAKIETLGMNLQGNASKGFKAIAQAHGGTYRDVGITPDGQKILDRFGPRKANGIRGPVWGIKLPLTKKKQ